MRLRVARAFAGRVKRPGFLPPTMPNFNYEEHAEYSKKYRSALNQKELLLQSMQAVPKPAKNTTRLVKDTNTSLENYQVWRDFEIGDEEMFIDRFSTRPVSKLVSTPKKLVEAFGPWTPALGSMPRATASLKFTDRNLDSFVISDAQRQAISPEQRADGKAEADRAREFWASDVEHVFWIGATRDSEIRRFKRWVKKQLADLASGALPSFGERMKQKAGPMNVFDVYEKDYSADVRTVPLIYRLHRSDLEIDGKNNLEFPEDPKYDQRWTLPPQMEDFDGVQKY